MCTAFGQWQRLNAAKSTDKAALERIRAQAISHMRFVVSLYEEQVDGGRYFLHEHLLYADSWELECVRRLSAIPEVQRVHGDQCQFGAQIQSGNFKGHPTKKPTGFLTNSPKLAEALARRCTGIGGPCSRRLGGRHRHLTGRHASDAARYPKGLCQAVIRGISQQSGQTTC